MPVCLIEAPTGIRRDAKKRLMEKTTAALNEAIPDVRIFLREYHLPATLEIRQGAEFSAPSQTFGDY
jgi:hypothetical protein